jgi:hypothetical protein
MKCSVQWAFHFSKHLVFSVIATERKKLEHVFMIIVKPLATGFTGIGRAIVQSSAH